MPEFNAWFPTSSYGVPALNVMSFGAFGDGAAHDMNTLFSGNLTDAQVEYPSATSLSDTADWCAITECFKQAFTGGTGVPVGGNSYQNNPVCFPHGQYLTRKPISLIDVSQAYIYGSGTVQVYNETTTAPNNICFAVDGLQYSRIENMNIQSAGGSGGIAFDLNKTPAATLVNTNGNLFINCHFACPGGTGVYIGRGGTMGSETTFIRCHVALCDYGFIIDNWNALNYNFLACGGQDCAYQWIRVNTGGVIVVENAALAANGEGHTPNTPGSWPADGCDIKVGAGTAVLLGCRTESQRFVRAGFRTSMFSCTQNGEGSNMVFAEVGSTLHLVGCESGMGRLTGDGVVTMDGCAFNHGVTVFITAIASGTAGVIRITHPDISNYPTTSREYWLDGDQVEIVNVVSSGGGAAATNGIWIIHKVDHTHVELVGSTFVADTYNYTNARIKPGPRFHLRDVEVTLGPSKVQVSPLAERSLHETKTGPFQLQWSDSGTVYDNRGATGEVVFTLPDLYSFTEFRGARFTFTVYAAQSLKIQVTGGNPGAYGIPARIFRAGAYGSAGAHISSNVVGNTVELYQADAYDPTAATVGHRWLVRSETGTWTIAGTPA